MSIPYPRVLLLHCRPWLQMPQRLVVSIVDAQRRWRQGQQLADMDARQLKDIGLTEAGRAALRSGSWWR